jgi:hypothetical protein
VNDAFDAKIASCDRCFVRAPAAFLFVVLLSFFLFHLCDIEKIRLQVRCVVNAAFSTRRRLTFEGRKTWDNGDPEVIP